MKYYNPKGPVTNKLQLSGSGSRWERKTQKCGDNTTFIWSWYRGGLPDSGSSRRVVQWSTGRSSLGFCGLLRMVQWGREVDSRRTVQVTSRCYSRLAELFRSRGSPPPWPARCPLVLLRGGPELEVKMSGDGGCCWI
jgi:hypothetical protein